MGLNYVKDKEGGRTPALDEKGEKLPMVSVNKGEKSTPVMLTTFTVVNAETKERIKYDDDDDKEVEIDEDEVVEYVTKNVKRDHVGRFEPEDIRFIVQGEMEYCDSLNMFD